MSKTTSRHKFSFQNSSQPLKTKPNIKRAALSIQTDETAQKDCYLCFA